MIAIVDYNGGNVRSVQNALRRIGVEGVVTCNPDDIRNADKVIFPGQGNIAQVRRALLNRGLIDVIPKLTQPFLGICVGMQLLYDFSEEGDTEGLGIVAGRVKRFSNAKLSVPQMGWNVVKRKIENEKRKKDFVHGIADSEFFYFANSYFCPVTEETVATADYGIEFCAMVQKNNFIGVQFHPEKSGAAGLRFITSFLTL